MGRSEVGPIIFEMDSVETYIDLSTGDQAQALGGEVES